MDEKRKQLLRQFDRKEKERKKSEIILRNIPKKYNNLKWLTLKTVVSAVILDRERHLENRNFSFGSFSVPQEVQEQFPDLVPQILASPSMDDEERKYWFSVLPIMTEDQIKELRDILKQSKIEFLY